MLNSRYHALCPVVLPYAERQHYMHGFDLSRPTVPEGFEDYLSPVIELCRAAGAFIGKAYLTVDEKIISPGSSQRRPGPHVDGQYLSHERSWGHGGGGGGWNHSCNAIPGARMAVIVASSVPGCRVWSGHFNATPTSCGDLSHISDQLGAGEIVPANVGYLLSPDCVHESMIFERETQRSFMRIALPIEFSGLGGI